MDFRNGVEEDVGGFVLQDYAHGPKANSVAVHFRIPYTCQDYDMCLWGGRAYRGDEIQPIGLTQVEIEQDDVRVLMHCGSKSIGRHSRLSDHCKTWLALDEHT
jgi:hypothetical protein